MPDIIRDELRTARAFNAHPADGRPCSAQADIKLNLFGVNLVSCQLHKHIGSFKRTNALHVRKELRDWNLRNRPTLYSAILLKAFRRGIRGETSFWNTSSEPHSLITLDMPGQCRGSSKDSQAAGGLGFRSCMSTPQSFLTAPRLWSPQHCMVSPEADPSMQTGSP